MSAHLKILEYALSSVLRRRGKNIAIIAAFTLIIAVLASILFLAGALKREAGHVLAGAPDIIVQKNMGGRHELIPVDYGEKIRNFPGVGEVKPRYWGYYYDSLTEANYTIVGAEAGEQKMDMLEGRLPAGRGECAVGKGVSELRRVASTGELILVDSRFVGTLFEVVGIFQSESNLLTNDLIVLTEEEVVSFFGLPPGKATDIMVEVHNKREVQTVAKKIKRLLPDTRLITRTEIIRTYDAVFNWRSGMMLSVFAGAVAAFCILAWDKATGLSAEEKGEIGILKAVGWDTSDVLELKFWEGIVISSTSFLAGTAAGYVHVYFLGAPLLSSIFKGWSVLFPDFRLDPHVDPRQIFLLAFLTVVPYVASTVIPSWKAAITEPEAAMRI